MGMILHCVFYHFPTGSRHRNSGKRSCKSLRALVSRLTVFWVSNMARTVTLRRNHQGYDSGFVIRFTSQEALATYANHPTHQALGKRLCDLVQGGADGIIVFDLETNG